MIDYEREEFIDDAAGPMVVYKQYHPGCPVVAASAYCVTRSHGYDSWCLWTTERLDRIPAMYSNSPLVSLAVEQCRRLSSGLEMMPRWEEEAWLQKREVMAS